MPKQKSSKLTKKKKSKKKSQKKKHKKVSNKKSQDQPQHKRKSIWPIIIGFACSCLTCCTVTAIATGIFLYLRNRNERTGPIYKTEPIVDILEPTGSNWYSTYEDEISLHGVASDVKDKIEKVEWKVEGGNSGIADGTTSWETDNIGLKEGDNKITVTAYNKNGNTGQDSLYIVYNKEIVFVDQPNVNPDFIKKGEQPKEITVSSTVRPQSNKKLESVKLYKTTENGEIVEEVGAMKDNGKPANGDDIPNDGTFGIISKFSSNKTDPIYLRSVAKLENSDITGMSSIAKIDVIEPISDSSLNEIEDLNEEISNLQNELEQQELTNQEIANQLNDFVSQQEAVASSGISQEGQGVWWVYENTCIPGGVFLNPPNTKGGQPSNYDSLKITSSGSGLVNKVIAQTTDSEVGNTKAIYLGPFREEFGQWDDYYGAWEKIKESKCPKCETAEKANEEVTVEDFKKLDEYGMVVISSHGDNWYGGQFAGSGQVCQEGLEQSQVVILTRHKVTDENIRQYEADLMSKRLAITPDGYYVILPSFISHYNSNFPNSLIYVASCRSSYNNTLASAFLGKGAESYIGFDDYVLSSYCFKSGKEIFDNFVLQGDNMSTTFSDTISSVGPNDGSLSEIEFTGSKSLTMGGKSFSNYSFEKGNLSSWTEKGDSRIISTLGPINPTDKSYMGIVSTGLGSVSDSKSSISQSICFSEGESISFDFNLVSEEPKEYLNTSYDDTLTVYLKINGAKTQILQQGINDSKWKKVNGIDFAGGDNTTFKTGWNTFEYSLSEVGKNDQLEIVFEISDIGDSKYDTAALIDNIKLE